MKTNELTGTALDWAVAKCEGYCDHSYMRQVDIRRDVNGKCVGLMVPVHHQYIWFSPSTDWAQGGPIIERERIGILFDSGSACRKPCWFATPDDQSTSCSYEGEFFDPTFMVTESVGMYGPTPLIAAMRCLVASKLGDEVALPDGL